MKKVTKIENEFSQLILFKIKSKQIQSYASSLIGDIGMLLSSPASNAAVSVEGDVSALISVLLSSKSIVLARS